MNRAERRWASLTGFAAVILATPAFAGGGAPAWQNGAGFRRAAVDFSTNAPVGLTLLPPGGSGLAFTNLLSDAAEARNRLLEIGSGVTLGDVDGDDLTDIYFCGLENDNALYRNLGNWRFEDVTARAGVACAGQFSTGCVLVDLDGDRDLDLLVNSLGGGTRLFRNDGGGVFTADTGSGLFPAFGATSMALGDLEGDGDLDLYVTNYRSDTFLDHPDALSPKLSRHADGSATVEPKERFLLLPSPSGGPLVIERGEPDVCYVNQGAGRFAPIVWNIGVFRNEQGRPITQTPTDWGLAVLFRDLNGDRLPDLYVCNDFVYWPDRVWFNRNARYFQSAPLHAFRTFSLASMAVDAADLNRDGFDDLFISDMLSPHREPRAWQRPDTLDENVRWPRHDPAFTPELPRNTLHLARGDGTYAEIAQLAGLAATDWTTAVAFLDVDLDGWEDLLLVTGNKHDVQDTDALATFGDSIRRARTPAMRQQDRARLPHRKAPSLAFRNRRDLTFEDASARWGFNALGVAHGIALGDLDNDGDLDVVVNAMNEPARLYRNDCPAPRLAVRLRGLAENTRGVGARLTVRGGAVTQTQEIMAGGRFCSSDDPMRVFATGDAARLEIEVAWRSGRRSSLTNLAPNHLYEVIEAEATAPPSPTPAPPAALFEDASAGLNHVHTDAPFDDFARQPLLPRRLSTLGPGVAWADVDGDGSDDLVIAGGRGGRCTVFRNNGRGHLTEWGESPLPRANERDQTAVLVWRGEDQRPRLVVGESDWENGAGDAPPVRVAVLERGGGDAGAPALDEPTRKDRAASPESRGATGPLALADVDGDGDLDLFVGGRVIPGRYPLPANSHLLVNGRDRFRALDDSAAPVGRGPAEPLPPNGLLGSTESRPTSDTVLGHGREAKAASQELPGLGLVSGAVFTDVDLDGDPDLALACEWGPIRILINDRGQFTDRTSAFGLARFTGWWNGITAGDFDGDGRMDLAASNWGRNWRTDQPAGTSFPVQLHFGEFASDSVLHTLLASMEPRLAKITPWRERRVVVAAIPAVWARFPDHHSYGRASVTEILGDQAAGAHVLEATSFDSMIFLNRGHVFEPRPLPVEAQFAPAFGLSVGDFDGDGSEDLFLAQNFFGVDLETSRQDAGTGLVLLGDGQGGFRVLRPLEAGISIPGEMRGTAVGDFDGDERLDLVVAQYSGPTRLFRNARGKPGVRVRLRGPAGNPTGVGAMVRLRFEDREGPAREIHAGSGYWSQDSASLILAAPTLPTAVWVRWPGGQEREWPWPVGVRRFDLAAEGAGSPRSRTSP